MKKKALLKLADMLTKDAWRKRGIQFSYSHFGHIADPNKPLSCGTKACALGYAALSGEFKGLGYCLKDSGYINFTGKDGQRVADPFGLASRVFGITREEARYLFAEVAVPNCGEGSKAELDVAKAIRVFVKDRKIPPERAFWSHD